MAIFRPNSPGVYTVEKDLTLRIRKKSSDFTPIQGGGLSPTPSSGGDTPTNLILWILLCGSWNDNYYWYDTSQWNDNTPC